MPSMTRPPQSTVPPEIAMNEEGLAAMIACGAVVEVTRIAPSSTTTVFEPS